MHLRQTGDPEGAMQAYQDALTTAKSIPRPITTLELCCRRTGSSDEAEHALKRAITQSPRYIEAHNNLAALYFSQSKDVDALRILTEALKIAPQATATSLFYGANPAQAQQSRPPSRPRGWASPTNPDNAEALTVLGQLLHETDRYDEAITVLEEALALTPIMPRRIISMAWR